MAASRKAYTRRKRIAVRPSRSLRVCRQEPLLCVSPKRRKAASVRKDGWSALPSDLLFTVLRYLQGSRALLACRRVCRSWWAGCEDPCLWRGVALSVTASLAGKAAFWDFAARHSIAHYHVLWYSGGLLGRLLSHAPSLSSLAVDKYERYSEELLQALLAPAEQALPSALHSITLRCSATPEPQRGRVGAPVKQTRSSPTPDELVQAAVDTLASLPHLSRVRLEGFAGRAFLSPRPTACLAVTKLTLRGFPRADLSTMAATFPGLCELSLAQCTLLCEGSVDCHFSSLTSLVLRHCSLGTSHWPHLHSLHYCDLAFCCLTSLQLQTVLAALPNGGLTHLDLSGNEVCSEVVRLAAIKLCSGGSHLVVRHCHSTGLNHHVLLWLQKSHPNAVVVR